MALSSVYMDVLNGVRQAVLALGIDEVLPAQVVIRKRAAFLKQSDSLPLVLVCPATEGLDEMQFATDGGGGTAFIDYPVVVVLVAGESKHLLQDLEWLLDRRQRLRRRLHRPLAPVGADTVFDCVRYDPSPAFDTSGLDALFDISTQQFVYRSAEARGDS